MLALPTHVTLVPAPTDASRTGTGPVAAVLLDERAGRYWQLNPTGHRILRSLLDGATPTQVARALADTHPAAADRADRDTTCLIRQLLDAGLLEQQ